MIREIYSMYYNKFIAPYVLRPMMEYVKNNYQNKNLIGVEIGVANGDNALTMLNGIPQIETLYLIDPWVDYVNENGEICCFKNGEKETREKVSRYYEKIMIIKKDSDSAIDELHSEVDFVYIDGNHDYTHVMNDLMNYYPLVKSGGVIGGQDAHLQPVLKAVVDFINKNKLESYFLRVKSSSICPDWWIVKP